MNRLNEKEMLNIVGGDLSGTVINAFARGINTILELGRSFGSAIRRISNGNLC